MPERSSENVERLITLDAALTELLRHTRPLPAQAVTLAEARGLVTVVIVAPMFPSGSTQMARGYHPVPIGRQGSGILFSLALADGLLVGLETMAAVAPGTRSPVELIHDRLPTP